MSKSWVSAVKESPVKTTMSLDGIHIDSKELIEKQPLDAGGFGMVSLCYRKNHGLVVLKTVYTGPQRTEYNSSLLEEGKMMHKLNHDRVIKLIGVILEDGNYSLVMEFMENGNLLQLLKSVSIPLSVKGRIVLEIIEGMAYLHEMRIVHKDLKPENILVDADYHIKIADLGVAIFKTWSRLTTEEQKRRGQMSSKPQNNAGTLSYLAPEHLRSLNTKATEKSDVYSFSIVVWVILTNTEPYENALNDTQVYHLVLNGDRPDVNEIPDEAPEEIVSIMQQCWENEPEKRMTFAECNLKFGPFYEENLHKYIDADLEKLRELSQKKPTAPRELVKRMRSLQADCVAQMPDHSPKDDPKSLHSSQGIPANGNTIDAAFSSCKLNESFENEPDCSVWHDEEAEVKRKLDEEYNYHVHGSRLDTPIPQSKIEQIRKERSKRVSNEPVFTKWSTSAMPSNRFTAVPSMEQSVDLYGSRDSNSHQELHRMENRSASNRSLSKPVKQETGWQAASEIIPTGNSFGQGGIFHRTPVTIPVTETGSPQTGQPNSWTPHQQSERTSSISLSEAKGVQIGDNNIMNIEKQSFKTKQLKDSRVSRMTPSPQHLEMFDDNNPVKESHLDLLRGELGKDWKHCARKLGFRESEIDEIDHDYERDGLKEKVYKMLYKWQMKEGSKGATVGKLAQALHCCKRSDLTLSLQNCI
ncbi:receptor-interacting serine/threonine-protein kinase 1 isoform X2 [Heptranchias perlo]|uniref:receptor-interacting serine/threonine-protein kinase 1 isoform X2 n=1 Tax=Heptranchias perlo TaxID=212740 RepID=UPI00355A2F95